MIFQQIIPVIVALAWGAVQFKGVDARSLVLSSGGFDLDVPHAAECCKADGDNVAPLDTQLTGSIVATELEAHLAVHMEV